MAPSAAEILERTASVYASCSSYRDTGEVVTVFAEQGFTTRRHFQTLYVRPALFRFEVTYKPSFRLEVEPHRYAVWADGQRIRSWWTLRQQIAEWPTITEALAGPTGVSHGAAYDVPSLLLALPDPYSLPLPETSRVRMESAVGNGDLLVISGQTRSGSEVEFSVDARTYLIRTIRARELVDQEAQLRSFVAETTTTYAVEVNTPIPPEAFAFTPPE